MAVDLCDRVADGSPATAAPQHHKRGWYHRPLAWGKGTHFKFRIWFLLTMYHFHTIVRLKNCMLKHRKLGTWAVWKNERCSLPNGQTWGLPTGLPSLQCTECVSIPFIQGEYFSQIIPFYFFLYLAGLLLIARGPACPQRRDGIHG